MTNERGILMTQSLMKQILAVFLVFQCSCADNNKTSSPKNDRGTSIDSSGELTDGSVVDQILNPSDAVYSPEAGNSSKDDFGITQKPDKNTKPDTRTSLVPGNWVLIKAGKFTMGSPITEYCRNYESDNKETQHEVTLTRNFEMQTTEVTQGQFKSLMKYNPSQSKDCGDDCPLEAGQWNDGAAYCNALSKLAKLTECYKCNTPTQPKDVECTEADAYTKEKFYTCPGYRLPTEAEWEYAYRAGSKSALHNDTEIKYCDIDIGEEDPPLDPNLDKIAWYWSNSYEASKGVNPHPVGKKDPNKWGLYDMAGSLREWVNDHLIGDLGKTAVKDPWGSDTEPKRVVRNGSYYWWKTSMFRAAYRWSFLAGASGGGDIGFRCVRTMP